MTYFKSLALANLNAALFSLRQQNFSDVDELILLDNDTPDDPLTIQAVIDLYEFPVPVKAISYKHKEPSRTHSWSTNESVRRSKSPWVFFTRADYILHPDILRQFRAVLYARSIDWPGFIVSKGRHLAADIEECQRLNWAERGVDVFFNMSGVDIDYSKIDSGVWMAPKRSFNAVGGLDESLTAWGHAQTHFQFRLHQLGVEFVCVPEILFFHPAHAATRDLAYAHQQLRERGIDLQQLWARYDGPKPYGGQQ